MADRGARKGRRWLDPRLAIGIGLVVASVAGVVAVVSASERTTLVYAAAAPLAAGDPVSLTDLAPAPVRLGALTGRYATAGGLPGGSLVATRDVAEGELVPLDALATEAATRRTRVVLTVSGPLAETVAPHALVDVWAARAEDRERFGPPAVIVAGARVVRVVEAKGLVSDGRSVSIELQIPKEATATVLEAQARQDAVAVLPAASSTRR